MGFTMAGVPLDTRLFETQGGVEKGDFFEHNMKIIDDELEGTGKGYEIFAGSWRYKKRYEYNEDGSISKVYWDQQTPGTMSGGVYSYVYNASGQLDKIIRSAGREEIFLREGDKFSSQKNILTMCLQSILYTVMTMLEMWRKRPCITGNPTVH